MMHALTVVCSTLSEKNDLEISNFLIFLNSLNQRIFLLMVLGDLEGAGKINNQHTSPDPTQAKSRMPPLLGFTRLKTFFHKQKHKHHMVPV